MTASIKRVNRASLTDEKKAKMGFLLFIVHNWIMVIVIASVAAKVSILLRSE